ncbi:MAG: hypothetical protein OEL51_03310 [Nitrosopumilus sp.]|nr:hypothetical protein [Nitrosopumilus sp.]MDH3515546.1 hypothetical protein [Nitrosopumilus sp.]MDH5554275.1 hypothetical protein [Nitrosopumilus sp.]
MKMVIFGIIGLLFFVGILVPSFGHTTVHVEQYQIEAGWGIEPPVVGIRNDLVFKITQSGETEGSYKGVTSVFKDVDTTVMFGGATKKIDVNSDPRPGYYFSPIIPTKTGTYMVEFKGEIDGTVIDIKIPIEDVESTAVLDFPPTTAEGTGDVIALKNAISSLQQDVSKLKSDEKSVSSLDDGASYDFAVFGLSIAAAAIILAIIALIKRK